MITIQSERLGRVIQVERNVAELGGGKRGPLIIVTCGMHGNEPSGVFAARDFIANLKLHEGELRGRIVAFAGNLEALSKNERFIDADLNRIWDDRSRKAHETLERDQLWQCIEQELEREREYTKVVHVDLHSTSSPSTPFIVMSETAANQREARRIPLPAVSGLDRVLEAPLLAKMAGLGHVSLAFEGGAIGHNITYRNHIALLWVVSSNARLLPYTYLNEPSFQRNFLERQTPHAGKVFTIEYTHRIAPADAFAMNPGFANFEPVGKGDVLGCDRHGTVTSPAEGLLFMPLYQQHGSEGFFVVT